MRKLKHATVDAIHLYPYIGRTIKINCLNNYYYARGLAKVLPHALYYPGILNPAEK